MVVTEMFNSLSYHPQHLQTVAVDDINYLEYKNLTWALTIY